MSSQIPDDISGLELIGGRCHARSRPFLFSHALYCDVRLTGRVARKLTTVQFKGGCLGNKASMLEDWRASKVAW